MSKPPKKAAGFSADERAAMRDRKKELAAEAAGADGEREVLAKIAEMPESDRLMAERLHGLIKSTAPEMTARTWYGMPAYAQDGKTICFFQSAHRFKARYATFGFSDKAKLDEGNLWPTSFALKSLGAKEEAAIVALLRKALG